MPNISEKIEKYKNLILKEAFKDVDPNNVTQEMLQAIVEKGAMVCPSKKKVICFTCGCFSRIEPNENSVCHSCDVQISI